MKLQYGLAIFLAWLPCTFPALILTQASLPASADELALPAQAATSDIRSTLPQPYIVRKGDTLWNIANYFFKDPKKWLKIWEWNHSIGNPDLIYPGNKIWLDTGKKKNSWSETGHCTPTAVGAH